MTVITATFKNARISPQKARVVAGELKKRIAAGKRLGMPVESAIGLLLYSDKKAAGMIRKVLMSAISNAEHNEDIDIDELKIVNVVVNQGPLLKRWRARAKGRSARIIKRSSIITVMVSD